VQPFDADGVADRPAKSAMDAKKGLGSNLVVSLLGAHMVNDNWKSQGPSYQLPARDVGFRLLGRRFNANKQSVSIKILYPAPNFGRLLLKGVGTYQRRPTPLLSPIVIWPRITSEFTSNCAPGYPQRDLWSFLLCSLIADLRPLACVLFKWKLDVRR
jgi:hypothetical protein